MSTFEIHRWKGSCSHESAGALLMRGPRTATKLGTKLGAHLSVSISIMRLLAIVHVHVCEHRCCHLQQARAANPIQAQPRENDPFVTAHYYCCCCCDGCCCCHAARRSCMAFNRTALAAAAAALAAAFSCLEHQGLGVTRQGTHPAFNSMRRGAGSGGRGACNAKAALAPHTCTRCVSTANTCRHSVYCDIRPHPTTRTWPVPRAPAGWLPPPPAPLRFPPPRWHPPQSCGWQKGQAPPWLARRPPRRWCLAEGRTGAGRRRLQHLQWGWSGLSSLVPCTFGNQQAAYFEAQHTTNAV